MAGISKLMSMGLLSIFNGGGTGGGLMDVMKGSGGGSDSESMPFGLDSGALGLNNSRIAGGKPWASSLLEGSQFSKSADEKKKSPFGGILGIGF